LTIATVRDGLGKPDGRRASCGRAASPARWRTYCFTLEDDNSAGSTANAVRKMLAMGESYDSLVEPRQSALQTDPSTGGAVIEGSTRTGGSL
jgi:hypothetical protein